MKLAPLLRPGGWPARLAAYLFVVAVAIGAVWRVDVVDRRQREEAQETARALCVVTAQNRSVLIDLISRPTAPLSVPPTADAALRGAIMESARRAEEFRRFALDRIGDPVVCPPP